MVKESFSNTLIINYKGNIMRFSALKRWIGMSSIQLEDIQPATREEIQRYRELQNRKDE